MIHQIEGYKLSGAIHRTAGPKPKTMYNILEAKLEILLGTSIAGAARSPNYNKNNYAKSCI
jgi:hypothetical protein